jgi:hypothetical protein
MAHLSLTVMAAKLTGQASSLFVVFHEPPVSSQTTEPAPAVGVGS